MASKTLLQLVNDIQARLREPLSVTVEQDEYTRLLVQYINETKREVEDAWQWNVLNSVEPLITVAGQESYTLQDTNASRFVIYWFLDDNRTQLRRQTVFEHYKQPPTQGKPHHYTVFGTDVNNNSKLLLYPTPDATYNYLIALKRPQGNLTGDNDLLKVPDYPVMLGAYAKAVGERGEDGGISSAEAQAFYRNALNDAISIESERYPEQTTWQVI